MNRTLHLLIFKLLLFIPYGLYSQSLIGEFSGDAHTNRLGDSVVLSSDGKTIAIGAPLNLANNGQVKVFRNINSIWTQIGDNLVGIETNDQFGSSISLSSDGNTIAIGAIGSQSDTGQVKVFRNINNSWSQIGESIFGEESNGRFGNPVSLSSDGNTIAIGASGYQFNTGQVKVFQNSNDSWIQIGENLDGEESNDRFGNSVSLSADGNTMAIGIPFGGQFHSGKVGVFRNINNSWSQIGESIRADESNDKFGFSVSLSSDGNRIAVGATGSQSNEGYVKVLERSMDDEWNQIGDNLYGGILNDYFVISVALSSSGKKVGIGIAKHNMSTGQVKIFENSDSDWNQLGGDINGENQGDQFGFSVSLSSDGSTTAIGAPFYNAVSGKAYVYNDMQVSTIQLKEEELTIFPNPTSGILQIKGIEMDHIQIQDSSGNVLRSIQKPDSVIDISSFLPGVYLLIIEKDENQFSKKVVKK